MKNKPQNILLRMELETDQNEKKILSFMDNVMAIRSRLLPIPADSEAQQVIDNFNKVYKLSV